jgi:hypothetical protein
MTSFFVGLRCQVILDKFNIPEYIFCQKTLRMKYMSLKVGMAFGQARDKLTFSVGWNQKIDGIEWGRTRKLMG